MQQIKPLNTCEVPRRRRIIDYGHRLYLERPLPFAGMNPEQVPGGEAIGLLSAAKD